VKNRGRTITYIYIDTYFKLMLIGIIHYLIAIWRTVRTKLVSCVIIVLFILAQRKT